jgi:hypothetical protein
MAERRNADKPVGGKKNFTARQVPGFPDNYSPRGSPARTAPRPQFDHDAAPRIELQTD